MNLEEEVGYMDEEGRRTYEFTRGIMISNESCKIEEIH